MPAPTSEDAHLYLQLLQLEQQPQFIEAKEWVLHELDVSTEKQLNEKHARGTAERSRLIQVLGFYESAGALVSRGLVHEDLFFDAPLGFETVWPKVGALLVDWQKTAGDDSVWENVVWLGRRYENWRETVWKPKVEAIPTDRPPTTKVWGETAGHVGFTKD